MIVVYVSQSCAGCQQVLRFLMENANAMAKVSQIKWADRDPAAIEELRQFGAQAVPCVVIYRRANPADPNAPVVPSVHAGAAAFPALVAAV